MRLGRCGWNCRPRRLVMILSTETFLGKPCNQEHGADVNCRIGRDYARGRAEGH